MNANLMVLIEWLPVIFAGGVALMVIGFAAAWYAARNR
jgi:hypothetical protein